MHLEWGSEGMSFDFNEIRSNNKTYYWQLHFVSVKKFHFPPDLHVEKEILTFLYIFNLVFEPTKNEGSPLELRPFEH